MDVFTMVCLRVLVVRCPGFLHEWQNEPIMAERAFLEAKKQLLAVIAKKQPHAGELKKKRRVPKTKQVEEVDPATPVCQTPDVNPGEGPEKLQCK